MKPSKTVFYAGMRTAVGTNSMYSRDDKDMNFKRSNVKQDLHHSDKSTKLKIYHFLVKFFLCLFMSLVCRARM